MMKRQLDLRREETAAIHTYVLFSCIDIGPILGYRRCDALEAKVSEMRAAAQAMIEKMSPRQMIQVSMMVVLLHDVHY